MSAGKRAFPPHIGRSRQWKARKRRELAALEQALDTVRTGCAYSPIYHDIDAVTKAIKAWRRDCSEKAWGR